MPQPEHRAPRVLVVDDEIQMAEMVADGLVDRGYHAEAAATSERALERLREGSFDALVTDLRMPEVDGLALLAAARRLAPELPVLVMTAYGAIDTAVESIRQGASHYLTKPFKIEELAIFLDKAIDERRVRREVTTLRAVLRDRGETPGIVGASSSLRAALSVVERIARTDLPVLLLGETGTGKGLFARRLHDDGDRAGGPFVAVNCAALPEPLLESELFGHVKGAFTGATRDRAGLMAEASSGTLFLDEIAEMSPALQAKLLHAIERRVVRAVGGSKERPVDIRIIAATHRDLDERVRSGAFREDLRYRLDVVSIDIPPLRHRRDDIPLLLEHFFRLARARHPASPAQRFSAEAVRRLVDYRWPGNVRELSHAVERMVVLARGADIDVDDLPPATLAAKSAAAPLFTGEVLPIRDLTRRYALWALGELGGHRTRTAEKLGIDMKTLAKWLAETDLANDRS
ncbi:Response regulator of zinc sigma-54-dependent two-component system [Minicystis rosea]|nr:Response regulator of zinc sigma-54-dependent two-component system [Minicystis rosea]